MEVGSATSSISGSLTGGSQLGKMDFLKLLTTQLTHQDPLNPMEDTQFVSQLAQFSSLEQVMETNEKLEMLALAQSSMTSASAVGFLGKNVEAAGFEIQVEGGVASWAGFHLDQDAESVEVEIRNDAGELVQKIEFGKTNAGEVELNWDGMGLKGDPVPDGTYQMVIKAKDGAGQEFNPIGRIRGQVTSVTFENGYAELLLGERRLGLADVIGMY